MYTQKISADLSSNIYSGNWNMQMRPAPDSEAAAKTGILHATKSHIYIHFVSQGGNSRPVDGRFRQVLPSSKDHHTGMPASKDLNDSFQIPQS